MNKNCQCSNNHSKDPSNSNPFPNTPLLKIRAETQYKFNTLILYNEITYSGVLYFILHNNRDGSYTHVSSFETEAPLKFPSIIGKGFFNSDGFTSNNSGYNVSLKKNDSYINHSSLDGSFQSFSGVTPDDCKYGYTPSGQFCCCENCCEL